MNPTMRLRWIATDDIEEQEGPCGVNMRYWPECGQTAYVLQQWWANADGDGEWRNVEFEAEP